MRFLIAFVFLFFSISLSAQVWKGAGIMYTQSAPSFDAPSKGSWVAVDTSSGYWYEWDKSDSVWVEMGARIQFTGTTGPPNYTPDQQMSRVAVNSGDSLYVYQTPSWSLISGGAGGAASDNQMVDTFTIVSHTLRLSLEDDAQPYKSVDLSPYLDDTDTQLSEEQVEDYAGGMVTGNTETRISVTYQDGDGTLDFVVEQNLSNYTNDAGFLTSEVDGSTSNELQVVDTLLLSGTTLGVSLSSDGVIQKTVDLSSLQDGTGTDDQTLTIDSTASWYTVSIEDGNSVSFAKSAAGSDTQDLSIDSTGTTYTVSLVDGGSVSWNKVTDTDTDTQDLSIDSTGTNYTISLVDGGSVSFNKVTDTDTQLSEEQVEDYVGGMVTGNTETLITVTYQDGDGTIDFAVEQNLSNYTNDAGFLTSEVDGSTSNELQVVDTLLLSGTTLGVSLSSDGVIQKTVDLSSLQDGTGTDDQTLTIDSTASWYTVSIEDGNSVSFAKSAAGSDTQDLSIDSTGTNYTISLVDGGSVSFNKVTDTDTQLTEEQVEDYAGGMVTGNTETLITVTYQDADGTIDFVVDNNLANYSNATSQFLTSEVDGSTSNEIQTVDSLGLTGTTLGISLSSDGVVQKTVDLASLQDGTGTDDQNLSVTGSGPTYVLDIEDGNDVTISASGIATLSEPSANELRITATEVDGSATNELQTLSWSAGTGGQDEITLSDGGGTVTITDDVNDADSDATNEIQDLSYTAATGALGISDGGTGTTIPVMTASVRGLTPDGDGSGTDEFLREDGTWAVPPDTDTQLSQEQVEDYAGAMTTLNTETLITVTYQDADGTIDYVVDNNLANYSNATSGFLTGNQTITLSGDVTGSGATSITTSIATGSVDAAELASTAVTPGSYTSANITVDADGRITAASSGAGAATGDLSALSVYKTTDQTMTASYADITTWATPETEDAPFTMNTTSGVIVIDSAGRYLISANMQIYSTGTRCIGFLKPYVGLGSGLTALSLESAAYARGSASPDNLYYASAAQTFYYDFAAGDSLVFRTKYEGAAGKIQDMNVLIFKMEGVEGPAGPAGADAQGLTYTASTGEMAISGGTSATIPVMTTTVRGLVPDGDGAGTDEFLREDGTWAVPPGTDTDDQNLTIGGSGPSYIIEIDGGSDVTVSAGGIVTLSEGTANVLTLTATEVDGSTTNEIQTIDTFDISSNTLRASLSSDGQPFKSVDLSPYLISGGVAGYLPQYTSATALDTTGMYWNGYVGIGTTGPDRKLDVLDASNPQLRLTSSDGSIYTDLQTTTSGYLYINPSGNRVGIGTSAPTTNLEVSQNQNAETSMKISNTTDGTGAYALGRFTGVGGRSCFFGEIAPTNTLTTEYQGKFVIEANNVTNHGVAIGTATATSGADIKFYTGGRAAANNRMTILNAGSVGIGTSSPDRLLHTEVSNTTTNAVTYAQRFSHITSSGTVTTNFGVGLEYELENASGTNRVSGTEAITFSDATNATEDATYTLQLIRAGSLASAVTILSTGDATFSGDVSVPDEAYGAGWNASTEVPTKNAVYDEIESLPTLAAGTYTPTLTGTANVASSTAYVCQYMRVGTVVTVSGKVEITPTTANTYTELGMTLPISSNLTTDEQCSGSGGGKTTQVTAALIMGDATNDRAEIEMLPGAGSQIYYFTFTYQVL